MLNESERQEIQSFANRYPDRQTASIDALLIAQRRRGWVSDEDLADVAAQLGMHRAELESVATFYNRIFRRPVGRHVISVCDSVSCYMLGGEGLISRIEDLLGIQSGQTTPDGMFTLLPNVCLGHCDRAPVMLVDSEIHTNLSPEKVQSILSEKAGRLLQSPALAADGRA